MDRQGWCLYLFSLGTVCTLVLAVFVMLSHITSMGLDRGEVVKMEGEKEDFFESCEYVLDASRAWGHNSRVSGLRPAVAL